MLQFDRKTLRFLARMGARGVLGQAVYDMAKDGKEFYVISADLARASGFERFGNEFSDRMLNAGIAESNMLGMASGLSSSGIPVIATTWATFASARIADQVRNYMGFMRSNVKLVGLDSGYENNRFGYTHTNGPDISIMSSIPNILILAPSDGIEIYQAIQAAVEYNGPVYIRLTGGQTLPIIHDEDYEFQLMQADVLSEGSDVAFFANGSILPTVIKVAERFKESGYSCRVVNLHTLCPVDHRIIDDSCGASLIVSVEEHPKNGGMGSMLASYLAGKDKHPPIEIIASKEEFTPAGSYQYALSYNEMDENSIFERVLRRLKQ